MVRLRLILWWLVLGSVIGTTSVAVPQPLEGADDPRLQRAVDDWLAGANFFPLLRMAALARQGNTAARLLLTQVQYRSEPWLQTLPRSLRTALFRDTSTRRIGQQWNAVEARRGHPLAIALSRGIGRMKAEEWIAHARTLLAWGERQRVLRETDYMVQSHGHLAEFADQYVTVGDPQQVAIWFARWIASWRIAAMPNSERTNRQAKEWSRHPWNAVDEATFRAAFDQGRLWAIMFQWLLNGFARSSQIAVDYGDDRYDPIDRLLVRWDMVRLMKERMPTPDEVRSAGALLVAEARHGGHLRPLHDLCRMNCGTEVELCMHAGVTLVSGPGALYSIPTPLESVISQPRWLASGRVRGLLLHQMRGIVNFSFPKLRREGRDVPDLGRSSCFRWMMDPGTEVVLK